MSCDARCELWKYDVQEYSIESQSKKAEESLTKQPTIAFDTWTGHLQWNKWATHECELDFFFLLENLFFVIQDVYCGLLFFITLLLSLVLKVSKTSVATNFSW